MPVKTIIALSTYWVLVLYIKSKVANVLNQFSWNWILFVYETHMQLSYDQPLDVDFSSSSTYN